MAYSPDGHFFLSGGADGKIIQWDMTLGANNVHACYQITAHNAAVNSLVISSDGALLASGSSDNTAKIWNIKKQTNEPVMILDHDGFVYSVAFSPDASLLATACADKTVYVWLLETGKLAAKVCQLIGRNLTQEEWDQFVDINVDYKKTCGNIP